VKPDIFVLIPLVVLGLTAIPAAAENAGVIMPMDSKASLPSYRGKGTINSVDAKAGRINLSHGPIPGLGWAAMTMDFDVRDKDSLSKLKPGQKVTFELIEVRKGNYVIGEIELVK